ncbi:MAG: NAD(P)H-dependent oxidoreductase, partial [Spirochaetia bacterium]
FSFDSTVQEHAAELKSRALLIIVHPDWWGQPPAVLKGWLDRVLRPGVAYDFRGPEFLEKEHVPLLTGMRAVVFATSDQQRPGGEETPALEQMWRKHVFDYCGIEPYEVRVFYDVRNSSLRTRKRWLRTVADTAAQYAVGDDHPNQGSGGEQVSGGGPSGNMR